MTRIANMVGSVCWTSDNPNRQPSIGIRSQAHPLSEVRVGAGAYMEVYTDA